LPIVRVIGLLEDVAPFGPKCLEKRRKVIDSVIDHERRLARCEMVPVSGPNRPDRGSLDGVAAGVRPDEGGATPILNIDAEVSLVPGAECGWILRVKEDPSDSSNSPHQHSSTIFARCTLAPSRSFNWCSLVSTFNLRKRRL